MNGLPGVIFGWIQSREFSMKKSIGKYALTITAVSAALLALPAQAVQVSFSGSSGSGVDSVTGTDVLGNTWATTNGPEGNNSSFTMADRVETPQAFNVLNFNNGLGTFANSFQLTINKSQQGSGYKGILETPVSSTLINEFQVQDEDDSWYSWIMTYNLFDTANQLYQQVLFTAPTGKQLSQGQDFKMNVNFSGIITSDAGLAASWDDRLVPTDIPEPGTAVLLGLGLVGLVAASRRKKGQPAQRA